MLFWIVAALAVLGALTIVGGLYLQQVASILTRPRLDAPSANQTDPLRRP